MAKFSPEERRVQAEHGRVAGEHGREEAEEGRVGAEVGRVTAQDIRNLGDSNRLSGPLAGILMGLTVLLGAIAIVGMGFLFVENRKRVDATRTNVERINKVDRVNRGQSCRVIYTVFKEQRTQIVQGRALIRAGAIPGLSEQTKKLLDKLYRERAKRVRNGHMPKYCGDTWRSRPNSVYRSKIVTIGGKIVVPLVEPSSGDLTMDRAGAVSRPSAPPKPAQRPPVQPQPPSRPKTPQPAPKPAPQKPKPPPQRLTEPPKAPDVTQPPVVPPVVPPVCVTVPENPGGVTLPVNPVCMP